MNPQPPSRLILLFFFGLFAASGFSGLIYESIWSHYLKLFLGHAAYAQTTVLAIFMGGMALGAGLAARYAQSWGNLLLAYALAEGMIGAMGLCFHGIFNAATAFAFDMVLPRLASAPAIQAFKYTLGSLLILPQSILLGSTFPLMSAGLIRVFPERSGSTLAMLYFTNSLGAVVGALASALFLVAAVGLPGSLLTAGLLNIVLALLVWLTGKNLAGTMPKEVAESAKSPAAGPWRRFLLIAAFFTGLSSFFYEIGWIRMLALVLGSSTRAFELMLAAFILGIALGGLWIKRRIDGLASPEGFLGVVQIAMGTSAAATLPLYGKTFDLMAWALGVVQRNDTGYAVYAFADQAIAMAVMFPASFCAGMTLPLITYVLLRRGAGERAIGQVYGANTLGAIAGVILAVHALIPLIGVKGLILSGVIVDLLLGAALLYRAGLGTLRLPARACAGATMAALVVLVAMVYPMDPLRLVSSVFRSGLARLSESVRVEYLRDGKTATVSLYQAPRGWVYIATNGKVDAAIQMNESAKNDVSPDEITMSLAAVLALAHQPKARAVANIGFGSGLTTHVLLGSDRLQSVDTVEIEPLMVEAAHVGFGPRVHRAFDDPRSRIRIEDAKTFFSLHPQKYDAIVSEPSNPWVSGVASLFSREFYRHVVRYLADDGVLVQWIQGYETNTRILASVLAALAPEFSDYRIYAANDSDFLIVAKKRGRIAAPDWSALETPALGADLRRVGLNSIQDLRHSLMGDRRSLATFFAAYGAPENSDYFPFVEQNAPRAMFLQNDARELLQFTLAFLPSIEMLGSPILDERTDTPDVNRQLSRNGVIFTALAIRDGTWKEAPIVSESLRKTLRLLELSASECLRDSDDLWLSALHEAAAITLPQLRPVELAPLLENWVPGDCAAHLSAEKKQWVDLYRAVAHRDPEAMARLAEGLLSHAGTLDAPRRSYLLGAAMLGKLASGHREEAARLWKTYAAEVLQGTEPPIGLQMLVSRTFESGSASK